MSFISLNQISPGLISSGMGHDHFTRDCCLGQENGCFLSAAHLSIDDHAKFCKLPQVLRNSCSGLVQHYPIRYSCLQSEFHWPNAPYLLLLWSVIVMSLCVWWLHVLMTIKTVFVTMSPMFVWPRPSTLRPGLTSLLTSERGLIMARPGRSGPGTRWAASLGVRENVKIMHKYSGAA